MHWVGLSVKNDPQIQSDTKISITHLQQHSYDGAVSPLTQPLLSLAAEHQNNTTTALKETWTTLLPTHLYLLYGVRKAPVQTLLKYYQTVTNVNIASTQVNISVCWVITKPGLYFSCLQVRWGPLRHRWLKFLTAKSHWWIIYFIVKQLLLI